MSHNILEKIDLKIKQADFLSPDDLVQTGLFGGCSTVRTLIQNKAIPSIRVSKNITLIPRESAVEFLKERISSKEDL